MSGRSTRNTKKLLNRSKSMPAIISTQTSELDAIVETDNEEDPRIHNSQIPGSSNSAQTPFQTPAESIISLIDDDGFPTEEEIKSLAWKIYSSKEQELRLLLHIEYLNIYISEGLVPKGLKINLTPSINDGELNKQWTTTLDKASTELIKLLINFHQDKLGKLLHERNELSANLNRIWDDEDKKEFLKNIDDELATREVELRKMKEAKLNRDRRQTKTQEKQSATETSKVTSKIKYADMLKKHIKEKLKDTNNNADSLKKDWIENAILPAEKKKREELAVRERFRPSRIWSRKTSQEEIATPNPRNERLPSPRREPQPTRQRGQYKDKVYRSNNGDNGPEWRGRHVRSYDNRRGRTNGRDPDRNRQPEARDERYGDRYRERHERQEDNYANRQRGEWYDDRYKHRDGRYATCYNYSKSDQIFREANARQLKR